MSYDSVKRVRKGTAACVLQKVRRSALCIATLSLMGMLCDRVDAQTLAAPDDGLTGNQIYARAIATWKMQAQAPYLVYDVSATLERKGRRREQREHVVFRRVDRTAIIVSPAGRTTFGRPRFIPDVAFRLVPRVASTFDATLDGPPAPEPTLSSLPTIGRSVATINRYGVTLIGREIFSNQPVYHLKLTPLFDPKTNSVREMWVDTRTFVTWGLIDESRYAVGPASGTFLLNAAYAPVHGSWLLQNVTTSGTLRFGFFAVGGEADVVFSNITEPIQAVPDYCFDSAGFAGHPAACKEALK